MAQLRWFAPGVRAYSVVTKCAGDEMLMRPDPETKIILAKALQHAREKHPGVKVVAFSVVSNHMHQDLRVDTDEDALDISDYMKDLDQEIAQNLNKLRGRHGHFFEGRPNITAVLDGTRVLGGMMYTHAQPVHHGLVERVEEWPGLSSFRAVCEGESSVEVAWLNEAAWREAGAKASEIADYTETASIPLAMPFEWEGLSERALRDARRAHEACVRDKEREERIERRVRGEHRRLPKPSSYTRIDPFSRPDNPTRKQKPWAYGEKAAVEAFEAAYSLMLASYRVASLQFRSTGVLCAFPAGTRPPWISRAPVMT